MSPIWLCICESHPSVLKDMRTNTGAKLLETEAVLHRALFASLHIVTYVVGNPRLSITYLALLLFAIKSPLLSI